MKSKLCEALAAAGCVLALRKLSAALVAACVLSLMRTTKLGFVSAACLLALVVGSVDVSAAQEERKMITRTNTSGQKQVVPARPHSCGVAFRAA